MNLYPSLDGLSVYFRDISENKRIQKRRLETQKLETVGQLAGGLAHELNNQLTLIMSYADLRLAKLPPDSPFCQDFIRIKNTVKKSAELTRQLLMFSRRQPLHKEITNLNARLQEYQPVLENLVDGRADFAFNPAAALWMIQADVANIEQVIINLTINARDSLSERGTIRFATANRVIGAAEGRGDGIPPGNYVELAVEDNGAGIAEQVIPHIFEPFFTTKDRSKGTGLGLAVVYGIVKAHDGWIDVQSRVGQGTRFEILFPAVLDSPEACAENTARQLAYEQYRGRGERIMIIEDQAEVLAILVEILELHGFTVYPCRTASEAILAFERQQGQFDLVLSDIILPDGRGTQLAQQLLRKAPSLKVILVSGYSDQQIQLANIRKLGFPFLAKPYTIGDVMQQITETLRPNDGKCSNPLSKD